MTDYYTDLNKIKAAGLEYATNGISAGDRAPLDNLLSGEWSDGLTGQDLLNNAGIDARFDNLEDYEQTDVCDYFMDGYYSADWPEPN